MRHKTTRSTAALLVVSAVCVVGVAPREALGAVVLSEVFFDDADVDNGFELVELYNDGAVAVDLTGYSLRYGTSSYGTVVNLSGSIGPGKFFVVGGPFGDLATGQPRFDLVHNFSSDLPNATSNGDAMGLFDSTPTLIDALIYGPNNNDNLADECANPGAVDAPTSGAGRSLERQTVGTGCPAGDTWAVSSFPTPGWSHTLGGGNDPQEPNDSRAAAQPLACPTLLGGVSVSNADPDWYRIEVPTLANLAVRRRGRTGAEVNHALYDQSGILLAAQNGASPTETISRPNSAAGAYFIEVVHPNSATPNLAEDYLLEIECQPLSAPDTPSDDAYEEDDDAPSATPLRCDTPSQHHAVADTDTDFFSYTVTATTRVFVEVAYLGLGGVSSDVQLRIDGGTAQNATADNRGIVQMVDLAAGDHTFEVLRGAAAITFKAYSIRLWTDAPCILMSELPSAYEGAAYDAELLAHSRLSPAWNVVGLPASMLMSASEPHIVGTPDVGTAAGSPYTITLSATTADGSDQRDVQLVITAPTAPSITTLTLPIAEVNVPYGASLAADGGPAPTWAANGLGLPAWMSLDPVTGDLSGTPTAIDVPSGDNVEVSATNIAGAAVMSFTVPVLDRPSLSTLLLTNGYTDLEYSAQVEATGADLTYDATGLPASLSIDPGTGLISGTPTAGDVAGSPYSVTLTVDNALDGDSVNLTLVVRVSSPAVVATDFFPDGQEVAPYGPVPIVVGGEPPPVVVVTALPTGLTFDGDVVSGTPPFGTAGLHGVLIEATNIRGTDSVSLGLLVNATELPSVEAKALPDAAEGVPYAATYSASGTGPLTYSATGLPSGLIAHAEQTVIAGVPAAGSAGTYEITLTAASFAGTGDGTLSLVVTAAPVAPTFLTTSLPSGLEEDLYDYALEASGTAPIHFFGDGLPDWLIVDSQSGRLFGTPPSGSAGTYSVSLHARNSVGTTAPVSLDLLIDAPPPEPAPPSPSAPVAPKGGCDCRSVGGEGWVLIVGLVVGLFGRRRRRV